MVRALTSHQCGPGSIPGLGVICGLSLLLVLVPAPRVFLRVLWFSSLRKNQHFKIPIRPRNSGVRATPWIPLKFPLLLLLLLLFLTAECRGGYAIKTLSFEVEEGGMQVETTIYLSLVGPV